MKILILCPKVPYPPKDGGSIATLGLARGLAEAGADITILCLNTRKHYSDANAIPEKLTSLMKIIEVYHDTEIHFTKALYNLFFSAEPYNGTRFISADFESKLISLLKENKYDIVQLEGPYMGYYIPVVKKYSIARISLRAHNVEYEIWTRKSSNETNIVTGKYLSMLSKRIKQHESRILKSIDLLVAISEKDEKLLLKLNPGIRSVVIPAGVDSDNYPEPHDPEYPSLFFYRIIRLDAKSGRIDMVS
jgi:polysaccharide biosynthesis protein PslH